MQDEASVVYFNAFATEHVGRDIIMLATTVIHVVKGMYSHSYNFQLLCSVCVECSTFLHSTKKNWAIYFSNNLHPKVTRYSVSPWNICACGPDDQSSYGYFNEHLWQFAAESVKFYTEYTQITTIMKKKW